MALGPGQPQPNIPATCVRAQQYASAIFVSFSFPSHKGKFGAFKKKILIRFFYFFKLRGSEIA
jgi:hypothetical protein